MKTINVKQLILIIIPIFLELLLQIFAGNVDKIMVSNDDLATSINQANSILDLLVVSLAVLSAASLILINQYKGAKEVDKEKSIYKLAFYFNLAVGILLSILIILLAKPMLNLMQVQANLMDDAKLYLMICGGFLFLQATMLTLQSYLRSNDLTKVSLLISLIFNVINVFLNLFFLHVLKMNPILAVALGSVISRFIGVVLLLIIVACKVKINLWIKGLFPLKLKELKKILSIALPTVGEAISYSLSQVVILAFINMAGKMGEANGIAELMAAPTAKTYATMIATITYLFVNATSQGMQILLGRYLGSHDKELASKLVTKCMIVSIFVSVGFATIVALTSGFLFQIFTSDKAVIDLCVKIMYIEIALELGRAINMTLVRALQTSGDVMYPTIMAILFCWIVATLGSYILGVQLKMGLVGVWIAMTTDELIRGVLFIIRFKSGKWLKYNLVGE